MALITPITPNAGTEDGREGSGDRVGVSEAGGSMVEFFGSEALATRASRRSPSSRSMRRVWYCVVVLFALEDGERRVGDGKWVLIGGEGRRRARRLEHTGRSYGDFKQIRMGFACVLSHEDRKGTYMYWANALSSSIGYMYVRTTSIIPHCFKALHIIN